MSRSDPIRSRYYGAIERADRVSAWLFYIGALLSFASLGVERAKYTEAYNAILIGFSLDVIALCALAVTVRLYLTPRAEDRRRQDFYASAFGIPLTPDTSDGYYNNRLGEPIKRIAAQILENSFFSKAIALRMCRHERLKVGLYVVAWVLFVLNRRTDLGVILAASQAVFSEQVLSRWLRLEWLRGRFERTFDDVYKLFQSSPAPVTFNAMALDAASAYETAKATAAITLSSTMFHEDNQRLSAAWKVIQAKLEI